MVALVLHIRCLVLFFILIQTVSLYQIHAGEDNYPDPSSSSFNEELNQAVQNKNILYDGNEEVDGQENDEGWESGSKRAVLSSGMRPIPQRRNYRPHWNPLVAAYKRCGELVSPDERESCFKHAVQMLFVYKLRK